MANTEQIPQESLFLTPDEVARILRISKPSVYRYLEAGLIPSIRMRGIYRCRRDQIERLGLDGVESHHGKKNRHK